MNISCWYLLFPRFKTICVWFVILKKKKFHLSNSSSNMNTFAQNCHTFLIKDFTRWRVTCILEISWKINSTCFTSCASFVELSQFLMYENWCIGGFGRTIVRTVSRNDRDSRRHDRCRWPHVTIDTRATR